MELPFAPMSRNLPRPRHHQHAGSKLSFVSTSSIRSTLPGRQYVFAEMASDLTSTHNNAAAQSNEYADLVYDEWLESS